MILPEQGSETWKAMRKKFVCASDSATVLGISPYSTPLQLWEEKLGLRPERPANSAMERGTRLEPIARDIFEKKYRILMMPEVKIHPIDTWMMASLDGISLDGKEILEIKCTNRKNHEIAKAGKIPEYYKPQVQHQIYVSGVDYSYYCSFDSVDIVVVVVYRDDIFINAMIPKLREFYECMITFTEPK